MIRSRAPVVVSLATCFVLVHAAGCAGPPPDDGGDDSSNALSVPRSSVDAKAAVRILTAIRWRFRDAYLAASRGDFVPTAMPKDENGHELPPLDGSLRTVQWAPNYEYFPWRGQRAPSGGQVYAVQARNYPATVFSSEFRDERAPLTVLSVVGLDVSHDGIDAAAGEAIEPVARDDDNGRVRLARGCARGAAARGEQGEDQESAHPSVWKRRP